MDQDVKIEQVDKIDEEEVLVAFTDGTWAEYTANELVNLKPLREPIFEEDSHDARGV